MTGPRDPDRADSLLVSEVFSAIQGEGAHVGRRQVFLRLAGCNIRCTYCDQPEALELRPGPCRIELTPGRRDWQVVSSPLPLGAVVDAVDRLWRRVPQASSRLNVDIHAWFPRGRMSIRPGKNRSKGGTKSR